MRQLQLLAMPAVPASAATRKKPMKKWGGRITIALNREWGDQLMHPWRDRVQLPASWLQQGRLTISKIIINGKRPKLEVGVLQLEENPLIWDSRLSRSIGHQVGATIYFWPVLESPEERNTFWLRGYGPSGRKPSPYRIATRGSSGVMPVTLPNEAFSYSQPRPSAFLIQRIRSGHDSFAGSDIPEMRKQVATDLIVMGG